MSGSCEHHYIPFSIDMPSVRTERPKVNSDLFECTLCGTFTTGEILRKEKGDWPRKQFVAPQ